MYEYREWKSNLLNVTVKQAVAIFILFEKQKTNVKRSFEMDCYLM